MTSSRKAVFLTAIVALAAILILASSLGSMEFNRGQPFTLTWNQVTEGRWPTLLPAEDASLLTILRAMMLIYVWILVPLALAYSLMSPEGRRKLIRIAGASTMLPLIIFALSRTEILANLELQSETLSNLPNDQLVLPTAIELSEPPSWLTFLLLLGSVAAIAGIGLLVYRRWWMKSTEPLEELADEAQDAIRAIDRGSKLSDVVIRCYMRMIDILQIERGLVRSQGSTPREFQEILLEHGLPSDSVSDLTQLFERARYGGLNATDEDKVNAVASLESISNAARHSG